MKDTKEKRGREITREIHDILWNDWDPFGVNDYGPDDEYDSYIGGIFRLLTSGVSQEDLCEHLHLIERDSMGMSLVEKERRETVAKKLLSIDLTVED